ncbi:MAG: hypothetical protein DRJ42_00595 [Deltaproteobacteria bacterium]|nr:MAG: hypothetical protein DRJ42_00595 [Deltaproteobacteria bacterium]
MIPYRQVFLPALIVPLITLAACGTDEAGATTFVLTFSNISSPGALPLSDGSATDVVYAPGAWAVFEEGGSLFSEGEAATEGLEELAEDGNNIPLVVAADDFPRVTAVGTYGQMDEGTYEENPIGPGVSVDLEITGSPGQVLSFASMFVQSNDVFVAPAAGSIPLFDETGHANSGDVTEQLAFFDTGTEVNEEPGLGANQAPRQSEAGAGVVETGTVTRFSGTDAAGFAYPALNATFRLTITAR